MNIKLSVLYEYSGKQYKTSSMHMDINGNKLGDKISLSVYILPIKFEKYLGRDTVKCYRVNIHHVDDKDYADTHFYNYSLAEPLEKYIKICNDQELIDFAISNSRYEQIKEVFESEQ
jgi:hypothetical protein